MDARTINSWFPRTIIIAVILTAVVALVSSLITGPSIAQGSAGSSFATSTHVQLGAAGIDVIWVSDTQEDGYVQFARSVSDLSNETGTFSTSTDVRGALAGRTNKKSHRVTVSNQPGGSTIFFNLVTGGVVSETHQVTIASTPLVTPGKSISGSVTFENGGALGRECIIRMRMSHTGSVSIPGFGTFPTFDQTIWHNALTNGGGYVLDAQNIRKNTAINSALAYDASSANSVFDLVVECDNQTIGTKTVTTADAEKDGANNFINVNFTVVAAPVAPSDYVAASGSVTIPAGSTSATISVTINGDTDAEDSETFNITLSSATNATVSGSAGTTVVTITNDEAPTFSIQATASVAEGAGTASLTITLSPTSPSDETISITTVAGSATAGSDFTVNPSTVVTVFANQPSATAQITILQDTLDEADETFQVVLSNPSVGTLLSGTASTSIVTITDDDLNPTVAVDSVSTTISEGNSSANITFQVNLSTASGQPVTVNFATANGTATGGSDFTSKSGTLTFPAGTTAMSTTIQILGDTNYEADEIFTINLSNGATTKAAESISITGTTTTVTLQNDDTPLAIADVGSTTEDTPLVVNEASGVLANDPNLFARIASIVTNGLKGTAVMNANGSYTYTPNLNQNGSDSFTYKYNDGRFDSNTATVSISISAVNDAPVAVDDFYAVEPGVSLSITAGSGLLANDTDADTGDTKSIVSNTALNPVIPGTSLSVSSDGGFSFNPGSTNDTQTFTYIMRDGAGETSTATVTLSQGPTFKIEILSSLPIDEDATGAAVNVKITLINATATAASTIQFSSAVGTTSSSQIPADSSDFTVITNQLVTLDINTTSTTISVPITNDAPAIREGLEYFVVQLSGAGSSGGPTHVPVISGNVSGVTKLPVSIDDTQDIPKLSIADVTLVESTGVAKTSATGTVTVTLTGRTVFDTEFTYIVGTTSTAPAAGAGDFLSTSGTMTMASSTTQDSTTVQIVVTLFDDTIDELNEIFQVLLSGPVEKTGGAKASVGFTDNVAAVTIIDDDNAPRIEILKPSDQLESSPSATISVKLNGASGAGVTVNFATSNGSATAGSDYTAINGTLTWAADESGIKTFTVTVTDDAVEEDGETVTLTLSGASTITTSPSTPGVSIATGTATLLILDDEPVAAIVTMMADGEVMPGDSYFLIVAGSNSPALSLSGLTGAQLTSPMNQTLIPIANVSEVVRKMLGLDMLRTKAVTHAWYAMAATSTGQQNIQHNVTLNYGSSVHNVSATLNVVTARTNRNIWIQDGVNFAGLALVPNDASIANLLMQPVWNANPALGGALSRQVTLADVIQSIFAFSFTNSAFFSSYNTADPISGVDAADTLTQLAPFQGMIIKSRDSVTPNNASSIDVFETVNVNGASTTVPIKINLQGPYLVTSGNSPLAPVTQQLRIGYNLIAPHVSAPTPFKVAFSGHGASNFGSVYGTALSFQKAVFPMSMPSMVGASVVAQFVFATADGGSTAKIDPILSYWLPVAGTTQPTVSASGPNSGGHP